MSYLFANFGKVFSHLIFLAVYTFLFAYAFVIYHDGFANFAYYKNPFDAYTRTYELIRWYYYNSNALTFLRIVKISLVAFATYFVQSTIWHINIRNVGRFTSLFLLTKMKNIISSNSGKEDSPSYFYDNEAKKYPDEVKVERGKMLEKICCHVDQLLYDLITSCPVSDVDITRMKKMTMIKIGYELEGSLFNLRSSITNRQVSQEHGDGRSQ